MSLEIEKWNYEGTQWDNVANIVPAMFKKTERAVRGIVDWIKQESFDDKFSQLQAQIASEQAKREYAKLIDESKINNIYEKIERRLHIMEQRMDQHELKEKIIIDKLVEVPNLGWQSEIERDHKLLNLIATFNGTTEIGSEINSIDKMTSIVNQQDQLYTIQDIEQNKEMKEEESKKVISNKSIQLEQQRVLDEGIQMKINNSNQIENDLSKQVTKQWSGMWEMMCMCVSRSGVWGDISSILNRLDEIKSQNTELFLELETFSKKNEKKIQQLEVDMKKQEQIGKVRFEEIFSYKIGEIKEKVEKNINEINSLKVMRQTSVQRENQFITEIQQLECRIDQSSEKFGKDKEDIQMQISQIENNLQSIQMENGLKFNGYVMKFQDIYSSLCEKEHKTHDSLSIRIDNLAKEVMTKTFEVHQALKSNTSNNLQDLQEMKKGIQQDLDKVDSAIQKMNPLLFEFQAMMIEVQNQLLQIVEMNHNQFNIKLQDKLSFFTTNIWKKVDKTESAIDKLVDTLIHHQKNIDEITENASFENNRLSSEYSKIIQNTSERIPYNLLSQNNANPQFIKFKAPQSSQLQHRSKELDAFSAFLKLPLESSNRLSSQRASKSPNLQRSYQMRSLAGKLPSHTLNEDNPGENKQQLPISSELDNQSASEILSKHSPNKSRENIAPIPIANIIPSVKQNVSNFLQQNSSFEMHSILPEITPFGKNNNQNTFLLNKPNAPQQYNKLNSRIHVGHLKPGRKITVGPQNQKENGNIQINESFQSNVDKMQYSVSTSVPQNQNTNLIEVSTPIPINNTFLGNILNSQINCNKNLIPNLKDNKAASQNTTDIIQQQVNLSNRPHDHVFIDSSFDILFEKDQKLQLANLSKNKQTKYINEALQANLVKIKTQILKRNIGSQHPKRKLKTEA